MRQSRKVACENFRTPHELIPVWLTTRSRSRSRTNTPQTSRTLALRIGSAPVRSPEILIPLSTDRTHIMRQTGSGRDRRRSFSKRAAQRQSTRHGGCHTTGVCGTRTMLGGHARAGDQTLREVFAPRSPAAAVSNRDTARHVQLSRDRLRQASSRRPNVAFVSGTRATRSGHQRLGWPGSYQRLMPVMLSRTTSPIDATVHACRNLGCPVLRAVRGLGTYGSALFCR